METMHKAYLGDSVYAAFDGYTIWLTTENGMGPSNAIALEPEVYRALLDYKRQIDEHYAREKQTISESDVGEMPALEV